MDRRSRQGIVAVFASVVFALVLSGAAAAGVEWCLRDPLFDIDGRVIKVEAYVPIEYQGEPLNYTLVVWKNARVDWTLPEGESLNGGKVTIQRDRAQKRNEAGLKVFTKKGQAYPLLVCVSGDGLDGDPFCIEGTSRPGVTATIQLKPN